jgi:hypothetical protein
MNFTKSNIHFALIWIRKLLQKNYFPDKNYLDNCILKHYLENLNKKLSCTLPRLPDYLWNRLLHHFFMMELGSTLNSYHIVLEHYREIVHLIVQYDEACVWKKRLQTSKNIGNLDYLPNDILHYISQLL